MQYNVWDETSPLIMQIIGKQEIDFFENTEFRKVIENFKTLPEPDGGFYRTIIPEVFELLISLYSLGYMHGIRQERQRRKGRKK